MAAEKKSLSNFHLYDAGGDLSKRWYVRYIDGGQRRKKYGDINFFDTKEGRVGAAKKIIDALKQKPDGDIGHQSAIIVKAKAWIEDNRPRWRKKTYQTNKSKLENFIAWVGVRKPTPEIVKAFFQHLLSERSGVTHNKYLRELTRIFTAIGHPYLTKGLLPVRAASTPAKYFQSHQIARIKKMLEPSDPALWLAIQFIYYCFIRPGELRLLKIGDINFDDWRICIRSDISKNKKTQYVSIPTAFRGQILELSAMPPNDFVFQSVDGMPTGLNTLSKRFRKALDKLGFSQEYKLYSWKHTGAVAVVKAGIGMKELQIQLRHASLDEVDKYLRQLGVMDLTRLNDKFPGI